MTQALDLNALRSFVAICETGTFRRAASRVHKSPSAISLQVGKLEEVLGVRLMERNARRVILTEYGEMLLPQARRLLAMNDDTVAQFRGAFHLSGRLRLAAPHDLGVTLVPILLRRVSELHPDVQVDVLLATSEAVKARMDDGSVNLALFNDVGAPAGRAVDLFSEPLIWLMSNGGDAADRTPLPLAIAEVGCAWRDVALAALQSVNRAYRVAYSSDTSMGQIAALRADLAVAALPRSLASRELIEVPQVHELPKLPFTFVRIADDGGELAKAVVSLIRDEMQIQYQPGGVFWHRTEVMKSGLMAETRP